MLCLLACGSAQWRGTQGRTTGLGFVMEILSQFAHFFGLGKRVRKAGFVQQGFIAAVLIALGKQASLVNDCVNIVIALQ